MSIVYVLNICCMCFAHVEALRWTIIVYFCVILWRVVSLSITSHLFFIFNFSLNSNKYPTHFTEDWMKDYWQTNASKTRTYYRPDKCFILTNYIFLSLPCENEKHQIADNLTNLFSYLLIFVFRSVFIYVYWSNIGTFLFFKN